MIIVEGHIVSIEIGMEDKAREGAVNYVLSACFSQNFVTVIHRAKNNGFGIIVDFHWLKPVICLSVLLLCYSVCCAAACCPLVLLLLADTVADTVAAMGGTVAGMVVVMGDTVAGMAVVMVAGMPGAEGIAMAAGIWQDEAEVVCAEVIRITIHRTSMAFGFTDSLLLCGLVSGRTGAGTLGEDMAEGIGVACIIIQTRCGTT
jgi:hypothetical protein